MGFRYERNKRGEYVDGHERDDVILARADFVRWVEERDIKDTVFIYQDETFINSMMRVTLAHGPRLEPQKIWDNRARR